MNIFDYDRQAAVSYARRWAFRRNPAFFDFENLGGDCTNFASQCIYAGSNVMNFLPVFGWFYRSVNDRTASWTGVEYLYQFLTENTLNGPFAIKAPLDQLEVGDIIQLGRATGDFYHSPIITSIKNGVIYVAAHTFDAFDRPLSSYSFENARGVHILGVRKND